TATQSPQRRLFRATLRSAPAQTPDHVRAQTLAHWRDQPGVVDQRGRTNARSQLDAELNSSQVPLVWQPRLDGDSARLMDPPRPTQPVWLCAIAQHDSFNGNN